MNEPLVAGVEIATTNPRIVVGVCLLAVASWYANLVELVTDTLVRFSKWGPHKEIAVAAVLGSTLIWVFGLPADHIRVAALPTAAVLLVTSLRYRGYQALEQFWDLSGLKQVIFASPLALVVAWATGLSLGSLLQYSYGLAGLLIVAVLLDKYSKENE